jgi:hypothetical protein
MRSREAQAAPSRSADPGAAWRARPIRRGHGKNWRLAHFILALFLFLPYGHFASDARLAQAQKAIVSGKIHGRQAPGKQNMNIAGQIAVTLAVFIGFGRLFLADEGDSHRLSGMLILAGLVGKVALSI